MKVEVYLKSKSQEFIYEQPQDGWTGRWSWAPPARPVFNPKTSESIGIRDLRCRREEFGGLIYNPKTAVVYKVDEEAITVLEDLQSGLKPEEIVSTRNLDRKTLDNFLNQLLN